MQPDQINQRYQQLQRYVEWSEEDCARVMKVAVVVEPHITELVEDFYAEIQRNPQALKVITGGQRQIDRLKTSLHEWFAQLLAGRYDEAYVAQRWRVGRRHVEIGLDEVYANAALARLRNGLIRIVSANWPQRHEHSAIDELTLTVQSLNKLLDLDLALISDAYQTEHQARQRPVDEARMHQQKIVSKIGERALAGDDIDDLMNHTSILLAKVLRMEKCEILELLPGAQQLVMRSGYGWPPEMVGSCLSENSPQTQAGHTLLCRQPVIVEDYRSETRFDIHPKLREAGAVSGMSVVIVGQQQAYGVLCVHCQSRRDFIPSDVDFLQSVANVLAAAIQRNMSESQLRESEQRLLRMVEHLPAGAVHIAPSGFFTNRAVEKITGYDRTELTTTEDWFRRLCGSRADEVRQRYQRDRDAGFPAPSIVEIQRKDGQQRMLEFYGYRSEMDEVWLINDVTNLREAQTRALQAERLATIGQMITGLAHESRNALQRIQSCNELLEMAVQDNDEAMQLVGRSQKAQDDLHRLYEEVRNYAAPISLDQSRCDLTRIWREAWHLLQSSRRDRDATLQERIGDADVNIIVDRFRMVQVFRNLLENALAACSDPVRIEIQCRDAELSGKPAIAIQLCDNGPGLSEQQRESIFEPFYTTKAKGTGLGMAIAERVVQAHQGTIEIGPQNEQGAEFIITLPRAIA